MRACVPGEASHVADVRTPTGSSGRRVFPRPAHLRPHCLWKSGTDVRTGDGDRAAEHPVPLRPVSRIGSPSAPMVRKSRSSASVKGLRRFRSHRCRTRTRSSEALHRSTGSHLFTIGADERTDPRYRTGRDWTLAARSLSPVRTSVPHFHRQRGRRGAWRGQDSDDPTILSAANVRDMRSLPSNTWSHVHSRISTHSFIGTRISPATGVALVHRFLVLVGRVPGADEVAGMFGDEAVDVCRRFGLDLLPHALAAAGWARRSSGP